MEGVQIMQASHDSDDKKGTPERSYDSVIAPHLFTIICSEVIQLRL